MKIAEPGDSELQGGDDRRQDRSSKRPTPRSRPQGKEPPRARKPKLATAKTLLLGITKASLQSRASSRPPASRKPPRCSPRPPWPARSITLVGLKENVILGHLIPAGTGFHTYQHSEVRIRPQALEALGVEKEDILARHFPLLDTPHKEEPAPAVAASGDGGDGQSAPAGPQTAGPSLDSLFLGDAGGDDDNSDSDGDGDDEE